MTIKKITDIFEEKEKTFSFEFFPPKTREGYARILTVAAELVKLGPDFMSVTYGAGGGNRELSIDLVDELQKKLDIPIVQHFTCVAHTRPQIGQVIAEIKKRGIRNVLALRGDVPEGASLPSEDESYQYSYQLCEVLRAEGDYFSIGVAGFPEGHVLCPDRELDAKYLKKKIDSGADYVLTQLFFDNKDYFEYVKRLRKLGVKGRIIPGILPIVNYNNLIKFCKTCGATVTRQVHEIFQPLKDDLEATLKAGIDFSARQCRELLKEGAPGIHFFTLNRVHPVWEILSQIK